MVKYIGNMDLNNIILTKRHMDKSSAMIIIMLSLLAGIFTGQYIKEHKMNNDKLQVKKLSDTAVVPTRAHALDAGYDLYSDEVLTLNPNQIVKINTNIAIKAPSGYYGQINDRSSVGSKAVKVYGGVIDHGYTGPIIICLLNSGTEPLEVLKGTKIAQIVFMRYGDFDIIEVDSLEESDRGDKGFGSSNTKP